MKKMVCQICEGADFVKEEGLFVCQGCGCKYSQEEIKKLLVDDGTDAPAKTVHASNTLDALYQAARNARAVGDYETAKMHYREISAIDPNSWEALFYIVIGDRNSVKNGELLSFANSVNVALPKVVELIKIANTSKEEKLKALTELIDACYDLVSSLTSASEAYYKSVSSISFSHSVNGVGENQDRIIANVSILDGCGNAIASHFGHIDTEYKELAAKCWEKALGFNQIYKGLHATYLFNEEYTRTLIAKVRENSKDGKSFYGDVFEKKVAEKKEKSERRTKSFMKGVAKVTTYIPILGIEFLLIYLLMRNDELKKYDLDKVYLKKRLKISLIISAICVAVPLIFVSIFGD